MRIGRLAGAVLAAGAGVAAQSSTCADGLYMIVARGTNEDDGPGSMGELADRVAGRIQGSQVVGLEYPATFVDPFYAESVEAGAEAMREIVTRYHSDCPGSYFAVMGFSQGAQLTGDAFCGGTGVLTRNDPLPSNIVQENVVAIVLFGDPAHTTEAPYNHGTSTNDGIFARHDIGVCQDYADRLVSYCDTGDIYCDRGDDRDVHGQYVAEYGDDVFNFIVGRYDEMLRSPPSNSSGSSSGSDDEAAAGTYLPSLVVAVVPMLVAALMM
ncbi:cutinase-domain-containing protein [Stachybotrys elegans]|uniref:Cutinase-domain-containing protein n=1 Tax=Stachybotrys elegans TaxID=80388 RepID=A0A8K0WM64_9HYPO|nr:cutinase-domain-containing protein [Stachybotrys elegans]